MSSAPDSSSTDAGSPDAGAPVLSGRQHITKALIAALWTYGGRGTGLLWTASLIGQVGVGAYGQYAMAYAAGAILSAPLDNPFAVRAIRESEDRFVRERSLRVLIALAMIVPGLLLTPFSYIIWFGLVASGGEMIFSALKSRRLRDGHPDVVQRWDTIRQVSAVVLGGAYLYLAPDPSLTVASVLFVIPYLVVALLAVWTIRGDRPQFPGPPKIAAVLFGENLAVALYLQGDVLLLGFLTDSTTVGYYSIAVVCAWALAQVGAALGSTYHEKLRDGDGRVSSGPPMRHTVILAAAAGSVLFVAGFVALFLPVATQIAAAMMIMSLFVCLRVVIFVDTVILSMQRRDIVRSSAYAVVVVIKLAMVAGLVWAGAVGAAIATVIADVILLTVFTIALRRPVAGSSHDPGGIASDTDGVASHPDHEKGH
ncbi:lipopolysaccharide biosynthesis protein [Williamsia sp. M5A3_1d]